LDFLLQFAGGQTIGFDISDKIQPNGAIPLDIGLD